MSVNADMRVPKIAELIAEQIQDDIAAGRLREGDGLPSEAAIMTSFGVCQRAQPCAPSDRGRRRGRRDADLTFPPGVLHCELNWRDRAGAGSSCSPPDPGARAVSMSAVRLSLIHI